MRPDADDPHALALRQGDDLAVVEDFGAGRLGHLGRRVQQVVVGEHRVVLPAVDEPVHRRNVMVHRRKADEPGLVLVLHLPVGIQHRPQHVVPGYRVRCLASLLGEPVVNVEDVHLVAAQPVQAAFHRAGHRCTHVVHFVGPQPDLGGDDHLLAPAHQRFAQRLLGLPVPVGWSDIEERDAQLQRPVHRPDGFGLRGRAPHLADASAAEPGSRHPQTRTPQNAVFHLLVLPSHRYSREPFGCDDVTAFHSLSKEVYVEDLNQAVTNFQGFVDRFKC